MNQDSPQVKIPPPLSVLFVTVGAFFLNWLAPASILCCGVRWFGGMFMAVGIGVILWSAFLFRKHQTSIKPWEPTLKLIQEGPYRFSRNPIYVSFLVMSLGIIFLVNNAWALILLVPAFFFLDRYVIRKEEAYLTRKFGQSYTDFMKETRRWL